MKKHNEGYVLIMVLVALVVLSLVCSLVLSGAVRNLHLQKVAAQRMSDKYAARGELERISALLESAVDAREPMVLPLHRSGNTALRIDTDGEGFPVLHVTASSGSVRMECSYTLLCSKKDDNGNQIFPKISAAVSDGDYTIEDLTGIRYTQPQITTAEEETDDGA